MKNKIHQFNLEDFNPDCMHEDDIVQWIHFIGPGRNPACARQWFPGQKEMFRYARLMRGYCENKVNAMKCRLAGNISEALALEGLCDKIYRDLPKEAKW